MSSCFFSTESLYFCYFDHLYCYIFLHTCLFWVFCLFVCFLGGRAITALPETKKGIHSLLAIKSSYTFPETVYLQYIYVTKCVSFRFNAKTSHLNKSYLRCLLTESSNQHVTLVRQFDICYSLHKHFLFF